MTIDWYLKFDKAIAANSDANPLFHINREFQYTSRIFHRKLKKQAMEQSMSRVGHCIDNDPTGGFWGIIKSEMCQMYDITDEASLRFAIKDYIRFYSKERLQNRYQCKSPLEVRIEALPRYFSFRFCCFSSNIGSATANFCYRFFDLYSCLFCSYCNFNSCCDLVPIPVSTVDFSQLAASILDLCSFIYNRYRSRTELQTVIVIQLLLMIHIKNNGYKFHHTSPLFEKIYPVKLFSYMILLDHLYSIKNGSNVFLVYHNF